LILTVEFQLVRTIILDINNLYSGNGNRHMASRFSFYSFPGYELLISTMPFFDINNYIFWYQQIHFWYQKCNSWYKKCHSWY